jgi:hypothetical protein
MIPLPRAAFPPPHAANDPQGLADRQAGLLPPAPPRLSLRRLLLPGALMVVVLSLAHRAAQAPRPWPPA